MKNILIINILIIQSFLNFPIQSCAQSTEMQQLLLDWQKLQQLKSILQDMYKGYLLASQGYQEISNLSKGNFNLHKSFLDGLLLINPALQQDQKIPQILQDQQEFLQAYQQTYHRILEDPDFTQPELSYVSGVYRRLCREGSDDLDELTGILTPGALRMEDGQRMRLLDKIAANTADRLAFIRFFNQNLLLDGLENARQKNETATLRNLYGTAQGSLPAQ